MRMTDPKLCDKCECGRVVNGVCSKCGLTVRCENTNDMFEPQEIKVRINEE